MSATIKQTKRSVTKINKLLNQALTEWNKINKVIQNEISDYHNEPIIRSLLNAETSTDEIVNDSNFWNNLEKQNSDLPY